MQLIDNWEYLDYFTEDEDLESAPNYKAKYYQAFTVENGRTVLKKIVNLSIDKINSQNHFLVSLEFNIFRLLHAVINRS